ncbi:uncharacterized protein EV420DRAFT_1648718 [Desarmillaria tabescens]|uniref:DUF6534 domain-containing protein n=1 Tax=Armillaria tabescens TaxID=1929756 RepID=A0AA39JQC1_ARMTA|nr:uncharacterized protein EV420DRAFT_1648718 [Desarmillaria tabescens]KAK0444613.1 hypothetical protein EV420DRAFT_1648718 [Desarmillaria tabescens]
MSSTDVAFNRNEQLGSILISLVVSAVMYGITTFQVYVFFKQDDDRPKDSKVMQGFVIFLWLLDTLQQAFVTQGIYWYLVTHFDDPSIFQHSTWGHTSQVFITAIMDFLCQGFLIRRIWHLTPPERKKIAICVVFIITTVSLVSFVAMMMIGVIFFEVADMSQIAKPKPRITFYTTLGAGMAADICIASCLCYQLSRKRPTVPRTKTIVERAILYTINTCVLTSFIATASFIALAIKPLSMVFVALFCLLSKFYFNTLMATLNSRIALRRHLEAPTSVSLNWLHGDETRNGRSTISRSSGGKETSRHGADLAISSGLDMETGVTVMEVLTVPRKKGLPIRVFTV